MLSQVATGIRRKKKVRTAAAAAAGGVTARVSKGREAITNVLPSQPALSRLLLPLLLLLLLLLLLTSTTTVTGS